MKKKFSLVEFSVDHPRLVVVVAAIITLAFMTQFARVKADTNPKNMLPATSNVRVWNDEVEKTFALHEDMIVVAVVNKAGVLNTSTLAKIKRLTDEAMGIKGVASADVSGFSTITNVTAEAGTLRVAPLMTEAPTDDRGVEELKKDLMGNPLFINRIISEDARSAAIYVPLEKGADGKAVADKLREATARAGGPEEYFIAGDPVARDTFGYDMFILMAVFAPLAGAVMLIVRYLMFKDLFLSATLMLDAMISVIWSMGLLIALGYPIHIMSSMAPVFLMAIATDSIHIFNEFYFRFRGGVDRRSAIIETMRAVARPVKYTALATAAGFGVLFFMEIIPVKVFGVLVAFGTVVLRALSFSFIPAMFMFVDPAKIEKVANSEDSEAGSSRFLKALASFGASRPALTVLIGLVAVAAAVAGTMTIRVNNNLVEWFKEGSAVRVADTVINGALGGTSTAYITVLAREDEYMKSPEAMRYIEGLQRHLEKVEDVGKTGSVVDYVKRINLTLHDNDPKYDSVPDDKTTIGQYLFLFSMSAKPSDLDNVVDYAFRRANVHVQMKTWDVDAMRRVLAAVDEYRAAHPGPLELKPAGIAYFNLVWNDEVLIDMIKGFLIALVVIFVILAVYFRSVKWALVAYVPLLFTVLLIYGAVGFIGKDFDMPIAVLSSLSLGMAVDFAIHFTGRFRERLAESSHGRPASPEAVREALLWTAARPGKGIMRNAVLFAAAFSVMLFAPLTPYVTVGAFIVSMMILSALFTITYLPALIVLFWGRLHEKEAEHV